MKQAALSAIVLLALIGSATTQPAAAQHHTYTCNILDAVSVGIDGKVSRNAALTEFATRNSPLKFETATGRLTLALGSVRMFRILSHGNQFEGLSAHEDARGVNGVLHIRTDIPGNRFLFLVSSSEVLSGTCERAPG